MDMKEKTDIEKYLENMTALRATMKRPKGFAYLGTEDFVLQEGQVFPWRPKPKGVKYGKLGLCYMNAIHLAMATGWTYCEGFASGFFPTPHAWVIDDEGFVVDNTWRPDQQPTEYIGVKMSKQYVYKVLAKKKTYGVIDDYKNGFPILKKKWKKETENAEA